MPEARKAGTPCRGHPRWSLGCSALPREGVAGARPDGDHLASHSDSDPGPPASLTDACLSVCGVALFMALFVYAFNSPTTAEDTPAANAPVCLVTRVRDTWKEPSRRRPATPAASKAPEPPGSHLPGSHLPGSPGLAGRASPGGGGWGRLTSSSPAGAGGARECRCAASTWGTAGPPTRAHRPSAETRERGQR